MCLKTEVVAEVYFYFHCVFAVLLVMHSASDNPCNRSCTLLEDYREIKSAIYLYLTSDDEKEQFSF